MWYQAYDKVNHLAKTIGYFTFSSIDYTTQITVAHCNSPAKHNQSKPSQKLLILWGLQTACNREHGYHDSLHSTKVYTLYPRVVISSLAKWVENLHVAMPAKAQSHFLWYEARRSLQNSFIASFSLYIPTEVSPLEQFFHKL
jgi:hypothetical protein